MSKKTSSAFPDVVCPLRCGQCCEYWRDVPALVADAAMRPNTEVCPHEGGRGCTLRRGDRPAECTGYLCDVAMAVADGSIDHNEGVRLKELGHICLPYKIRKRRRT